MALASASTCTGCGACVMKCQTQALRLVREPNGFLSPHLEEALCIHCKQCELVCPVGKQPRNGNLPEPRVYACWSKNSDLIRDSSSGGLFSELAQATLSAGGRVYGARYAEDLHAPSPVFHTGISKHEDLSALRGSKYLQSDLGDVYSQVQTDCKKGERVLFSGTPCQVAGLYSFLENEQVNLLTCDVVCAGVPSPAVFSAWIAFMEGKHKKRIQSISFRDKKNGWAPSLARLRMHFEDGSSLAPNLFDTAFGRSFGMGILNRECCGNCEFCGKPRRADLTLADFWGLDPSIQPKRIGVSLCTVNSAKGERAFGEISEHLHVMERTWEEALAGNPRLGRSRGVVPGREAFFQDFENMEFSKVLTKHMQGLPLPIRIVARQVRLLRGRL